MGKSRTLITNTLRLLKLPETIQQMIRSEQISTGHARALLGIENPILQLQLAQEIVKKSLSVRDIEKRISLMLSRGNAEKKENVLTNKYSSALSQIKKLHGFELKIVEDGANKGKFEIQFANVEEFEKIIEILSKEAGVSSNKNKGKEENAQ
jgi:ParB family chromosome partitioning protein